MSRRREASMQDEHSTQVLGELHSLWKRNELCDIKLWVDGATFEAHKVVLSAASGYFQGMFLGNMKENSEEEVHIYGINKNIFSLLLDFIYSGFNPVQAENCQELLAGADMLGLSRLLEICCNFLIEQLDPSNALGIMQFADHHSCVQLKEEAVAFVEKHFLEVTDEEEYFELRKDLVISLLQSERLQISNEFQVFQAAMKWIEHDIKARRTSIFAICEPIRFPIIPSRLLETYIEECRDLSLKIALKTLCKRTPHRKGNHSGLALDLKHPLPDHKHQPRKFARKSIYVTGGYCRHAGQRWADSVSLSDVHCFSSFHQTWTEESPLHQSRSGHGTCALNGRIYVVGGESDSMIFDTTEMLDPGVNTRLMDHTLMVPRCGLGLCALGDAVYAFGGWIGSEIGASVEKFDPEEGCWIRWDRMTMPRYTMGVVECEGLIYLAGGTSDVGTEMDLLESYNPVTKEWLTLPPMSMKRAFVGLAVIDNMLYAVGGWNEESGSLSSVERYDIDKMKWECIEPMSVSRAGAGVASLNGCLYVMGGRTDSSSSSLVAHSALSSPPDTLASVECYEPEQGTWRRVEDMPVSRCEAAVTVL